MTSLALLIADANSHTAAPPDESIAIPIIVGILAAVLGGGWLGWRIFSNRSRNPVGETLSDPPGEDRFARGGEREGDRVREPERPPAP